MTVYLLAGGGTAGHVNPLLAVADRLRERDPGDEVLVLGTAEGLESRLVPDRGYELLTIAKVPFPRRPNRAALAFPSRFSASIGDVRSIIAERGVDVVVGFGGYVATPAYLAARRESVPVAIHEANAKPGLANRLGARWAAGVGVAFAGTPLRHAEVVGMPLRREIEQLDRAALRDEAARFFGLDPARPVLLATGGSLGARRINRTMVESAAALTDAGWQVLHIAGAASDVVDPGLPDYRMVEYADRMDLALAIADAAVSRAGRGHGERARRARHPGRVRAVPGGQRRAALQRGRRGRRRRRHPRRRRRLHCPPGCSASSSRSSATATVSRAWPPPRHPSAIATAPTAWSRSSTPRSAGVPATPRKARNVE